MSDTERKSIPEILADPTVVDKAMNEGVRQALLMHKRLGNPIAIWRDGEVVWLQPEEIPVEPADEK